jgi:hypothetical protein
MCCIPVSMSVALCVGYAADRPSNHISYPTCVLVLLVRPGERKSPWCHHRPAMTSSAWTANFNCPSASTSHSLSFSVASASYGAGSCYDPYIYCLELGALSTSASAGGNFFAIANSSNSLWLNAFCKAYAAAYAQACTFTKVDGDIKVETSKTNRYKGVSLSVTLKTATKSLAYASSVAVAKSFVDAGAYSYTDVAAFCTAVKNKSPFCGSGHAGTGLTQVAAASAKAVGAASSLATTCSVAKQNWRSAPEDRV